MLIGSIIKRTLELKGHRMESVVETERRTLSTRIATRRGSRPACSIRGGKGPGYDQPGEMVYRHVPIWGMGVELRYGPRRVQCKRCGIRVMGRTPMNYALARVAMAG